MRAGSLLVLGLVALTACENESAKTPLDARGVIGEDDVAGDEYAQQQATAQVPAPMWPRRFAVGDTIFATYEPQIDSWVNDKLEGRVAVEAFARGSTNRVYGVAWFEARTHLGASGDSVTLDDVRVVRVTFPTTKEREGKYLEALRAVDVVEARNTTVARLKAQLAYGAKREDVGAAQIKNDPPRILVSERPAQLVLVDGDPRWRQENGVQRLFNTRALILRDNDSIYVWVGDRWFRSSTIDGAYQQADAVPPAFGEAKRRLEGSPNVDLFTDSAERARQGITIVVATKPTELIETRGAPVFETVPGTTLSFVSNSDSDVLRDATGATYLLLSGRWFRAASLQGPWTFVAGNQLPSTFRDIPRNHREARVLASIPGTPEAEEAGIAASVPETATIDRSKTRLAIAYDGAPQFKSIEGDEPLTYAVNTATPVVATPEGMYYAVENGVWFVAASPDGPWTVATSVPDAIYRIPVSSPIHYVTYVRIYGYSDDYAFVGYTPGYLGAIYTDDVVVWGTGYYYSPWIGSVWYGAPWTWGFGIGFGFGFGIGWGFGPAFVVAGGHHHHHPWWGPGRYGHPGWGGHGAAGVGHAGVYQHWGAPGVHGAPGHAAYGARSMPGARGAAPYGRPGGGAVRSRPGAPTTLSSGTYYRGGGARPPAAYGARPGAVYGGRLASPPAGFHGALPGGGFHGAPSGGYRGGGGHGGGGRGGGGHGGGGHR